MAATTQSRFAAAETTQSLDSRAHIEEARFLRWGGMAGIAGSALFLAVFVFVGAVVGPDPTAPEGPIGRFPEIRAARTLENTMYLAVLVLWTAHVLALHRVLKRTSPGPAIFGAAVSVMGLVLLAAGALPHAATVSLAALYHAPGVSAQDQAGLILAWQTTQAIFNALLVTGLVLLPIGVIGLGSAMRLSPGFGRTYGWTAVALGVVGAVVAVALLIDPQSFIAVVGFLALMVFHAFIGWRVVRLARSRRAA
jgi:hypothetical protein